MIAYATHEFELSSLGKDGKSLRDTLETVARMKGIKPQGLINPAQFPMVFAFLWECFLRMSNKRTNNGFGVNPITYLEIDAFSRLTNTQFSRYEIEIIETLDSLALNQIRKNK